MGPPTVRRMSRRGQLLSLHCPWAGLVPHPCQPSPWRQCHSNQPYHLPVLSSQVAGWLAAFPDPLRVSASGDWPPPSGFFLSSALSTTDLPSSQSFLPTPFPWKQASLSHHLAPSSGPFYLVSSREDSPSMLGLLSAPQVHPMGTHCCLWLVSLYLDAAVC